MGEKTRVQLCQLAQELAETYSKASDGLRVVCVVTDMSGDFVGVGMNTAGDDADRILRCAVAGEDLEYHDPTIASDAYSREGKIKPRAKRVNGSDKKGREETDDRG